MALTTTFSMVSHMTQFYLHGEILTDLKKLILMDQSLASQLTTVLHAKELQLTDALELMLIILPCLSLHPQFPLGLQYVILLELMVDHLVGLIQLQDMQRTAIVKDRHLNVCFSLIIQLVWFLANLSFTTKAY